MMPLEMMPVGANGENAAALQAPTTSGSSGMQAF